MTTTTPTLDPVAAPGHPTDSTATRDTADRYTDTLRVLGTKADALNTALVEAHVAADPHARRQTLTDLHQQLRAMSGLANDALGGWPDPAPEPR
jgi:hypothetical protein